MADDMHTKKRGGQKKAAQGAFGSTHSFPHSHTFIDTLLTNDIRQITIVHNGISFHGDL